MRHRAKRIALAVAVLSAAPIAAAVSPSAHGAAGQVAAAAHATTDGPVARKSLRRLSAVRIARRDAAVNVQVRRTIARRLATRSVVRRVSASDSLTELTHQLRLRWPVSGQVDTPFIPSGPLRHDGIDIARLASLDVSAAYGGQVIHVGYTTGFEGYGNIVDVLIAPGIETIYAHLSADAVHEGERVREGQSLGTAGCTGRCSGTHLHFEIRLYGRPVDPLLFLH